MTGDREERNRVLGFPVDRHPNRRPARKPRGSGTAQGQRGPQAAQPAHRPQAEEPQRVLGVPVDWLDEFAGEVLRPLLRRLRRLRDRG